MRGLVQQYANTPVLVSGRHSSLAVARSYGFMRAVSVEQLSSTLGGAATPFSVTPSLPGKPCPLRDSGWGSVADPFGAPPIIPLPLTATQYTSPSTVVSA